MPGNEGRRGAVRKSSTKKGPQVGTGGKGRRALEGRGPTPKAEDRTYHVAHKRKQAAQRRDPATATRRQNLQPTRSDEVVAGRNAVLEALQAGIPAQALFVQPGLESDSRVREILVAAAHAQIGVVEASKGELDQLTGIVHQGVALRTAPFLYADLEETLDGVVNHLGLVVALDHVTDVRNLGAVLRSAAAFGADAVVIPTRRAAGITAAAWKASAGAAARVPVAQVTNLVQTLRGLQQRGYFVIGLDGAGTEAVDSFPLSDVPLVVVTGAEGEGLSRLVRETCDLLVGIEIAASTESLNASVATGIALYEVVRRRRRSRE